MTANRMYLTRSRRGFLTATGAVLSIGGLAGCTGEDGPADDTDGDRDDATDVPPAIDEHMEGARMYDGSIDDRTGEDEVVIAVGAGDDGVAFDPPAVRLYAESVVRWEWTGDGGVHNVASASGSDEDFRSGNPVGDADTTFEQSFDGGIQLYECEPHQGSGMRGAIEVIAPTGGGGY